MQRMPVAIGAEDQAGFSEIFVVNVQTDIGIRLPAEFGDVL